MNKLKLDEEAITFLTQEVCAGEQDIKVDANLYVKALDHLKKTFADDDAREACARACKALLAKFNDKTNEFFDKIMEMYQTAYKKSEPKIDDLGRKKINPLKDSNSDLRHTLARLLIECIPLATTKAVNKLLPFFVPLAISDRNTRVQELMLEASLVMINEHGSKRTQFFMSAFQTFLSKSSKGGENDVTRRNVIVLIGNMARHLEPNDPQVKVIITQLLQALNTPSQVVQEAVAQCFPPLVEAYRKESTAILKDLNKTLMEGNDYGQRKGAAYGMAGIIKGLGMSSIKYQTGHLKKGLQDTKVNKKIGSLIGVEVFMAMLGRLFEPYINQLLPSLLLCFGDANTAVRQATEDACKVLMRYLSATGVSMYLPVLVKAIDEDAWRTKVGSVQLLASMGNCAPKQLSLCLPTIVPKVIEALSDSHMKVQEAAEQALQQLCKTIRNPEIFSLAKKIIAALQDPSADTHSCLSALATLEFRHYIDAASLSLIMPILQRGFKERSSETRKIAAQIIGALYALTNQADLSPYLASVIPGIKTSILDPAPEVRAVTAAALGAMVRGSGEDVIVELMPWLLEKLTCDISQVDRSGAAQAIAEVVGALGPLKLDEFMEQIILTIDDPRLEPHVKDGYLMLFIYFPIVIRDDFSPYVGLIITPVLNGLAEDVEYVRDTALLAGQRIVDSYSESAVKLLLPELERGLYVDNWRIRHSSVRLIGDLLYKICGITGKMYSDVSKTTEFGDGSSEAAIRAALGEETGDRIISGLYMCRPDISSDVKQAAMQIWKMLITNTTKTLREIMPTLFTILMSFLADDDDEDKQQMALRTLGDLVKKLGERFLPDIIDILEDGFRSSKVDQRQGVCIALGEIIASTSRETVLNYITALVPLIRKALHDPQARVRDAAVRTFDKLHQSIGPKALDEVLPPLLKQINNPQLGPHTVDGLKHILALKSRIVLPFILPHLTENHAMNTRALALLAPYAGEALGMHMAKILPGMMLSLTRKLDTEDESAEATSCSAVLKAADEFNEAQNIIGQLLPYLKNPNVATRRAAVIALNGFCQQVKLNAMHTSQILRGLIMLYTNDDKQILGKAHDAITCVTKRFDTKTSLEFISDVRNAFRSAISESKSAKYMAGGGTKHNQSGAAKQQAKGEPAAAAAIASGTDVVLPGLAAAYGFLPLSMMYREVIVHGSPDKRELAASSLCDIIAHSSVTAMEGATLRIAGMLMRVMSEFVITVLKDRHQWPLKLAILDAYIALTKKVGAKINAFFVQSDYTLKRMLLDENQTVRAKATEARAILHRVTNKSH